MSDQEDIHEHISNGSYGKITAVNDDTILKTMQKYSNNNAYYKQNVQEIVFLSVVKHENIIESKRAYITDNEFKLELEKGESSLHDYINKFKKSDRMEHFKYIFFQLVKVLYFLHKNKFIHGDLKPNNILISTVDMKIKLIDFGGICSFRLNKQHKPICTPSFCPPEGWEQLNINCLDTKFDVWSLAMTLYFYISRKYLLDFHDDKTIYYVNEFKWSFDKYYHHNIDQIKNIIDLDGFKLLEKMLMYDPDDRISSDELYFDEYFSEFKKVEIERIQFQSEFDTFFMTCYDSNNWKYRNSLISYVFDLCNKFEIIDHFILTIWIIDNYVNKKKIKISSRNFKLLSCSGLLICSLLFADKNLNCSDFLPYIPKYMQGKFQNNIDDIMTTLEFKLYIPTFDSILKNKNISINYLRVIKILNDKRFIGMNQNFLTQVYLNI